jgi:predicted dehydrogenase
VNKLGVGIYGLYSHQIDGLLLDHPRAALVAAAGVDPQQLKKRLGGNVEPVIYDDLHAMLRDDRVQLVSLASPRRSEQARQALQCMAAGRHVYAEKPAALSEAELNEIISVSRCTGMRFHEMAGTAFEQPYAAMRDIVRSGRIGQVIQVFAQKSYPWHERRPQDEAIDGGLVAQVGVHATRMVEHVAGQRVESVLAIDTKLGNRDDGGELRMAASIVARLANGGVASIIVNYLNPRGFGIWGNEHLRIFGSEGMLESTDGGRRTRLVVGEQDLGEIDTSTPTRNYFDHYIDSLLDGTPMPVTLEQELHPTRVILRARDSARAGGTWVATPT